MDDLVKRLRGRYVIDYDEENQMAICNEAASRIEALEKALETYAEDCDMTCCETIHRQGHGCGYVARAALEGKND